MYKVSNESTSLIGRIGCVATTGDGLDDGFDWLIGHVK
jgi:hypothetical protein